MNIESHGNVMKQKTTGAATPLAALRLTGQAKAPPLVGNADCPSEQAAMQRLGALNEEIGI
jgi:hypothetical protein